MKKAGYSAMRLICIAFLSLSFFKLDAESAGKAVPEMADLSPNAGCCSCPKPKRGTRGNQGAPGATGFTGPLGPTGPPSRSDRSYRPFRNFRSYRSYRAHRPYIRRWPQGAHRTWSDRTHRTYRPFWFSRRCQPPLFFSGYTHCWP